MVVSIIVHVLPQLSFSFDLDGTFGTNVNFVAVRCSVTTRTSRNISLICVGVRPRKVSILINDLLSSIVIRPEAVSSTILNGSTQIIHATCLFQVYQRGERGSDC